MTWEQRESLKKGPEAALTWVRHLSVRHGLTCEHRPGDPRVAGENPSWRRVPRGHTRSGHAEAACRRAVRKGCRPGGVGQELSHRLEKTTVGLPSLTLK